MGHITNDLEPFPHVGGGVTYSSVVAARLGLRAHIITKCAVDSPYIKELEALGITVHVLPARDKKFENKTTAFRNRYDKKGNRTQICPEIAEDITLDDLAHFPEIPKSSIILMAPVIGEISLDLLANFSLRHKLTMTPQGYFREVEKNHVVTTQPADLAYFKHIDTTILSLEDLAFSPDGSYLDEIKKVCPVVVCTQAEEVSQIFVEGKQIADIPAFMLEENEIIDFTGSGDSYAASFLYNKSQGYSLKEAGYFASLYAALKISGVGGKGHGLVTLPTKEQVDGYIKNHSARVSSFFNSKS